MEIEIKPIPRYQMIFAFTLFSLLSLPGVIFWCYFFLTDYFNHVEPSFLRDSMTPLILQFQGLPSEIINTVGVVLSAFLATIALRPQQLKFTTAQLSAIALLIFVTFVNLLVVIFYPASDPRYGNIIINGELLLPKLINASNDMYKLTLSYILIIVGLQSQMERNNDQ